MEFKRTLTYIFRYFIFEFIYIILFIELEMIFKLLFQGEYLKNILCNMGKNKGTTPYIFQRIKCTYNQLFLHLKQSTLSICFPSSIVYIWYTKTNYEKGRMKGPRKSFYSYIPTLKDISFPTKIIISGYKHSF